MPTSATIGMTAVLFALNYVLQIAEGYNALHPATVKHFGPHTAGNHHTIVLSAVPRDASPPRQLLQQQCHSRAVVIQHVQQNTLVRRTTIFKALSLAATSSVGGEVSVAKKRDLTAQKTNNRKVHDENKTSSSGKNRRTTSNLYGGEMDKIPLGHLTQENTRDIITSMRDFASLDPQREDTANFNYSRRRNLRRGKIKKLNTSAPQRRRDATLVEQCLERLIKEHSVIHDADAALSYQSNYINVHIYNLAIIAWSIANVRGSAEKADRILRRLIKSYKENLGNSSLRPNIHSFAYAYAAWYKESVFEKRNGNEKSALAAMRKAHTVLDWMKQILIRDAESNDNWWEQPSENTEELNSLLDIFSMENKENPDLAETFLRFVENESKHSTKTWTNTQSYNTVIKAWAESNNQNSFQRADAILSDMENGDLKAPNLLTYSGVISCLAKRGEGDGAEKALEILNRVEMLGSRKEIDFVPDKIIFNQVMNLFSKSSCSRSAERCEELLERMQHLSLTGNSDVAPDVRTYNLVLTAWANEKGPVEAEKVLERIEMHDTIQPNSISYITCMDSYAKIGDVHNSLRILTLMENNYNKGNADAKPTRRAYTSALNALSKSGRGDAGVRGEALVQKMNKMYLDGDKDMQPDTTVYNVLINCHKNSAEKAEEILYRMGKRDVVSYSSVINAYSLAGGVEAAKKAQLLLDKMQKEDVIPNAQTFNSAITAWSRSGGKGAAKKAESLLKKMEELYDAGNSSLEPSALVYTSVISAWAKSRDPGSALRAEILLKLMRVMYKRGNKSIKPNSHTFTSVISAWARSGESDAGERAEALLDQMIKLYREKGDADIKPNVMTLTAVIDAYARSGGRNAAFKANSLFKKMDELDIEPNLLTYNVLISAWGNSRQQGAGKMAESILTKLETEYRNGNLDMKPTVVSYTSCINAWAKSTESGKALRAKKILERLKKQCAEDGTTDALNVVTYSSVLNACATTYGDEEEKQEALQIACVLFKELIDSQIKPNHVAYSTFLKCLEKLMPSGDKRDSLVSSSFQKCCRDGQVDENCFFRLKKSASPELFSDLMGGADLSESSSLTIRDIPLEWRRNVVNSRNKNQLKAEI